jgi:molecular chaperone DnaJ
MEIDFMEAINGAAKNISFSRIDVCGTCKGTKAKPGTSPSNCGSCGGSGFTTIR